jgi:hypothetical protein
VAFYVDGRPLDPTNPRDPYPNAAPPALARAHFDIPAGRLQLMTQDAVAFDDVRIYSQPLPAAEIQALCKSLKFGQPPPEELSLKAKRAEAAVTE